MIYPKIEDCVERAGGKYTLAVLVAKRAKDLTIKMPGEFSDGRIKELTYALDEVLGGKITPYASGN